MNRNLLVALIIVAIIVIGGIFVLQSRNTTSTPQPATEQPTVTQVMMKPTDVMEPQISQTPSATGDAMMNHETKEFTISNKGMTFTPSQITVKKGDMVKITFKNTGGMHDLTVDGYNVATKVIQSGQEDTIEFTADKAGTFEFYCSVQNHRAMGMIGKLIVQ